MIPGIPSPSSRRFHKTGFPQVNRLQRFARQEIRPPPRQRRHCGRRRKQSPPLLRPGADLPGGLPRRELRRRHNFQRRKFPPLPAGNFPGGQVKLAALRVHDQVHAPEQSFPPAPAPPDFPGCSRRAIACRAPVASLAPPQWPPGCPCNCPAPARRRSLRCLPATRFASVNTCPISPKASVPRPPVWTAASASTAPWPRASAALRRAEENSSANIVMDDAPFRVAHDFNAHPLKVRPMA